MFYVYEHIRLDTNATFYIGKGSGRRVTSKCHRNRYWRNVVNKAGYDHRIIFTSNDEELAFFVEEEVVDLFRARGMPLVNQTNGGKGGISGYSHTEETRNKISRKLKGKLAGQNHPRYGLFGVDNPMHGRKQSASARQKMSENASMKRPEVKAKISGKNSVTAVAVECRGVIYPTLKDLAKAEGVSPQAIRSRIHRKQHEKYGYNVIGKARALAKDFWTDEDLTPFNDAIAANGG